jgi:hypothetical protein
MQPILHMSIAGEYCIEQWNEILNWTAQKERKRIG